MRVLLHCNGGPSIGAGHVLRSLAVAEEALSRGHSVTMAGTIEGEFLTRQIGLDGMQYVAVPTPADSALADLTRASRPNVLHVDSYDPGMRPDLWFVGETTRPLVSNIEDGRFGRRTADVVIDPNHGAESEPRIGPAAAAPMSTAPVLLRGSRYVLVRRSVRRHRGAWSLRPSVERVLLVMGGTDATGMTGPALMLLSATGQRLDVTVVVPNDGARRVSRAVAEARSDLRIHPVPPLDDLPGAMAEQDLVVSAAGTTVWELCCIGVPMALVCTVDNQRGGYRRVVAAGAAVGLGSTADDVTDPKAVAHLMDVFGDPDARRNLSERASALVDGLGAGRIVRTWEQLHGDLGQ